MKKLLFPLILASLSIFTAYAQKQESAFAEEIPEFPGGTAQMNRFITRAMRYPEIANINGICGRVHAKFVIDTTGGITDITIVRSVHPVLDSEAIRVLKTMPNWKPGRQNGRAVKVYFTLPVMFRLSDADGPVKLNKKMGFFTGARDEQFDKFPMYPGNIAQLLKVDEPALPTGTVNVLATINEDGTITETKIIGKAKDALEEPALEKVKTLQQGWTPATKDRQNVVCEMILPVKFNER